MRPKSLLPRLSFKPFEFSIYIPLGWTRKKYYDLEYMRDQHGWQSKWLLFTVDYKRSPLWDGWAYQYQVKQFPTRWTVFVDKFGEGYRGPYKEGGTFRKAQKLPVQGSR